MSFADVIKIVILHLQFNTITIAFYRLSIMTIFTIKTTGRAVLRRSHFPTHRKQTNLTSKRHTSNNSVPAPRSNPSPETSANATAVPIPATIATVPLWQRLGPLTRSFQAYGRAQRKRPYTTQFCSSLVIYFLGDLSAQSISGDDYDWKRTLRALVISMGSSIPSYNWFVPLSIPFALMISSRQHQSTTLKWFFTV